MHHREFYSPSEGNLKGKVLIVVSKKNRFSESPPSTEPLAHRLDRQRRPTGR